MPPDQPRHSFRHPQACFSLPAVAVGAARRARTLVNTLRLCLVHRRTTAPAQRLTAGTTSAATTDPAMAATTAVISVEDSGIVDTIFKSGAPSVARARAVIWPDAARRSQIGVSARRTGLNHKYVVAVLATHEGPNEAYYIDIAASERVAVAALVASSGER